MPSFFLTRETAELAVNHIRLAFETAHQSEVIRRGHLAVVVVDPTVRYVPMLTETDEFARFLTKAVIFVGRYGLRDQWQWAYDWIAVAKAFDTWKTGLPSRRLQNEFAYNCVEGGTIYGGSVIDEGGLVVACSGVDPEHDEGFAGAVMSFCKAYAQHAANAYRVDNPKNDFYGGAPRKAPQGINLSTYRGRYDGVRCPVCDCRNIKYLGKGDDQVVLYMCSECKHEATKGEFLYPIAV